MLTDKLVESAPAEQQESAREHADAAAAAAAEAGEAAHTVAAEQGRHFCDDHDPEEFECCQYRDREAQNDCLQENMYYYYEPYMAGGSCYYYEEGGSPDPNR